MTPSRIRRLGPGDEAALERLAHDATDFTDEPPSPPLTPDAARAYLNDPGVWHWHAEDDSGDPLDVMFEEIGVRQSWRGRGVGRALVTALHAHMREQGVRSVWVAADSEEAQAFYRACGYDTDELQGVILSRTLDH